MEAGVASMEKIMGCKFGDAKGMPLLVAVRSGARDSMPGMMDTILNLGLNDQTVLSLVQATNNERFAWDCYRRFRPDVR
jgi:pyruvate,orthophosphate dikinase